MKPIIHIIIFLSLLAFASWYVSCRIESEGGIKQVVIDTGRDVKDIYRKINEE